MSTNQSILRITTGRLPKLEELKADPRVVALRQLSAVWGVGPVTARRLYSAGLRSVADLRRAPPGTLTVPQAIGLARYEDLQERMPCAVRQCRLNTSG